MTTPEEAQPTQQRQDLFNAIQTTLREQGTNVQVAGTAPVQQIVTFDLEGDGNWTMTVNKNPE